MLLCNLEAEVLINILGMPGTAHRKYLTTFSLERCFTQETNRNLPFFFYFTQHLLYFLFIFNLPNILETTAKKPQCG